MKNDLCRRVSDVHATKIYVIFYTFKLTKSNIVKVLAILPEKLLDVIAIL